MAGANASNVSSNIFFSCWMGCWMSRIIYICTLSSNIIVQHFKDKMVDTRALGQVIILNELVDSGDEKPHRGKTRRWVKRRSDWRYFNNIMKELRVEDRTGFRDMFWMDVADFEYILTQISDLISSSLLLAMLLALFFFALPCL